MQLGQISVTLTNLTTAQFEAINTLLTGEDSTTPATTRKTRGRKVNPEKTVDDEEDENFGKKSLSKKDLEEDEEEADTDSDSVDSDDDSEEDDGLSWEMMKATMNKYGDTHPQEMKVILLTHGIKKVSELKQHRNKWEPVYRKTMSKIKALKKSRH